MKNNKHTPGPWIIEYFKDETIIEGKDQTVATNVSNCDANIIAAAPEMLEALNAVSKYFDGNAVTHAEIKLHDFVNEILAKARGDHA